MATLKQHDHQDSSRKAGAMLEEVLRTKNQSAPPPEETTLPLPDFEFFPDIHAKMAPEPALLIGGDTENDPRKNALIHQGDKVMLGAESKAGKTWWMLQKALCIASGIPFLGHKTSQGLVLYCNFELRPWAFSRRVLKVSEALGLIDQTGRPGRRPDGKAINPLFIAWNLRGKCYDIDKVCAVAEERIAKMPMKVAALVVDPLYKSYGGKEENSATDMAAVLDSMERFGEKLGAAIFISSHFAKGDSAGKAQIDRISGSGVIARDPDSIMTLSKLKDEKNCFIWEATLRNMACPEPKVVEFDYPVWKVRTDLEAGGKAYDLEKLAALLPDAGMSSNEWRDAAAEQGICGNKNKWAEVRDACVSKGFAKAKTGPRNSQIFTRK
jgi:hypothetical protein